MKSVIDGWSIVIIGAWNRMIFMPEWMSGRLTECKEIPIELPISNPALPPRFSFDNISLSISSRRLQINPRADNDETLEKMESVSIKILNELPHTPIQGTGVNFQFVENNPPGTIIELFSLKDLAKIAEYDYQIRSSVIKRMVIKEEQIINLSITMNEKDNYIFDINFHKDTLKTSESAQFLQQNIVKFRDWAYKLLEDLYSITF